MITKNEQLANIYKSYSCAKGHKLKWRGMELESKGYQCNNCNLQGNNVIIRWSCEKCSKYFCNSCFKIYSNEQCPVFKHKLNSISSFPPNYICDRCFKFIDNNEGIWIDKECDIKFCKNCHEEGENIPFIIED